MREAFGVGASWRDIPGTLSSRAQAILSLYESCEVQAVSGGMGVSWIGVGYRELRSCFEHHGIDDPEIQDLVARAFSAISKARSQGKSKGEEQLDKERRGKSKAG